MLAHQLPHPLGRVADVEQPPGQRLDPAQRPPLVISEPVRQRPPGQPGFQPGPLLQAQLLPRHRSPGPQRLRPAIPPGPVPRPHRPCMTRRSFAISLISSPRANRPAASSRSRSRRCCCPAGVYPPRCAYRMIPSYARNQPTSRPELYELILVGPGNSWRPGLPGTRARTSHTASSALPRTGTRVFGVAVGANLRPDSPRTPDTRER